MRLLSQRFVIAAVFWAVMLPGCDGSSRPATARRKPPPVDIPPEKAAPAKPPAVQPGAPPEAAPPPPVRPPAVPESDGPKFFVAPGGRSGNPGSKDSPWDIASALGGKHRVPAGATIYLREGTYRTRSGESKDHPELFAVRLRGAEGKPIHVRPFPGERARIDGGLSVQDPSEHLWLWDLEIFVSEPTPAEPVGPGSHPAGFTRPWGGLHVFGGHHIKFINFVIHDCRQGVSWWVGNQDSELYGAIIYDNGWLATDRGHGHCIYTQNKDGVKRITDCILTCKYPGTYTLHAYGSKRADCDNYFVEGNIVYALGTFLIGSGKPSHNIRVLRNALYSVSMRIGYNAPENVDCEVRDNIILNGALSINRYQRVVNEGNLVVASGAPRPKEARVFVRPNRYDPTRAHIAVFNFAKAPQAEVDVGGFLRDGQPYALYDPKDLYGPPLHEGVCRDGKIVVPMQDEFAVFVLRTDPGEAGVAFKVYNEALRLYARGESEAALKRLREGGAPSSHLFKHIEEVSLLLRAMEAADRAGRCAEARRAADALLGKERRRNNLFRRRALDLVRRYEESAKALVTQARSAAAAGRLSEAGRLYAQALARDPKNEAARTGFRTLERTALRNLNLALYYRERDPARAVRLLKQVLDALPEDHPSRRRAARELAALTADK